MEHLFDISRAFSRNTHGAARVDWVVLTGAVVSLGLAILTASAPGTKPLAEIVSGDTPPRSVVIF